MRTIGISLLLLGLAASAAAAGETERITYADAALDATVPPANAWADIVSGGLELVDNETLAATLDVTALPEFQVGSAYIVVFSDGTREWYAAAYAVPTLAYAFGPWTSDEEGPGDFIETSGTYTIGAPGSVRIEFPLARFDPATSLSAARGLAADVKVGALPIAPVAFIPLDASPPGDGELRLPRERVAENEDEPATEPEEEAAADEEPAASDESAETPSSADAKPERTSTVPVTGALAILGALVGAILASGRKGA